MPVSYMGENPVKQLMLANGTLLVTDLFATPQEAVARFGKRIRTMTSEMRHSQQYNDGIKAAKDDQPYFPPRLAGRQAVLEYGTGYLRGLIEKAPATPLPKNVLTEKEHNAMMDRAEGRVKK